MNLKTRLCDVHWGQSSSLLALLNVSNQRQFAIPMSSRTQCMHKGKKKTKKQTSHVGKKSLPTQYKALTNCKLINS